VLFTVTALENNKKKKKKSTENFGWVLKEPIFLFVFSGYNSLNWTLMAISDLGQHLLLICMIVDAPLNKGQFRDDFKLIKCEAFAFLREAMKRSKKRN